MAFRLRVGLSRFHGTDGRTARNSNAAQREGVGFELSFWFV